MISVLVLTLLAQSSPEGNALAPLTRVAQRLESELTNFANGTPATQALQSWPVRGGD